MYEDHGPVPWEYQIGPTRQSFAMQTKAESQAMRDAPDNELGYRVAALDPGHHFASAFAVYDVH